MFSHISIIQLIFLKGLAVLFVLLKCFKFYSLFFHETNDETKLLSVALSHQHAQQSYQLDLVRL